MRIKNNYSLKWGLFLLVHVFVIEVIFIHGKEIEIPKFAARFMGDKVRLLKVPDEFKKQFPYFWSGFDEEKRPIWVLEFGKWDIRKMIEGGDKTVSDLDAYIDHMVFNLIDSLQSNQTMESVSRWNVIIDMDKWPIRQITSAKTVFYMLEKFRNMYSIMDHFSEIAIVINVNYPSKTLVSLLRPILGSIMERIEVFGTLKSKWIPYLRNKFPHNQIPELYGGDKDFTPVGFYGKK